MRYDEVPVYDGPHTGCVLCLKKFRPGDVFTLADGGQLAFCYSDRDGGCLYEYMFFKMKPPRALFGNPYVFRGHASVPATRRPDPPPRRWWQFWKQ